MNKLAVITAFLGGVKNRYITYQPERSLAEKLALAGRAAGIDGVELCYPGDFADLGRLKALLEEHGLGVSSINVRSRRDGKWLRGSFTSASAAERAEVVDDFRRAMDVSRDLGTPRLTTCPLNDGHDYAFEINYLDAYRHAADTFARICDHDRGVRVGIEYKWNDPRTRCLLASAGETLAFCQTVGAANLGVTFDFGHSLLAGERPAQAAALLAGAGKLFLVHLNDNDRNWDWDMLPGAFHLIELVELFYYLREIGYDGDWYAYDVMSKEIDTVETFEAAAGLTRRIEGLAARLDRDRIAGLLADRNPARSLRYLYEALFGLEGPERSGRRPDPPAALATTPARERPTNEFPTP
jgi:xylose isomerase